MRSFILAMAAVAMLVSVSSVRAVTFVEGSFEQACQKAKGEGKVLVVDFYATWCGPCKVLDEKTWPDADVTRVLEEKGVPIKVDIEKYEALAKRYQISSVPTVLVLRADGTELDRMVGYRDAKTFLAEFAKAMDGRDLLTRAKADAAEGAGNDPAARGKLAEVLAGKGRYAEALAEYLWCFDRGAEVRPEYDTERLMKIPDALALMSRKYPAAGESIKSRRAEREAKARAGQADENALREIEWINQATKEHGRSMELFDSLDKANPCRPILAKLLIGSLVENGRYEDLLTGLDAKTEFAAYLAKLRKELDEAPAGQRALLQSYVPEIVLRIGGDYFEALAGTKRDREAREIATAILAVTDTPESRQELAERAKKAKNPAVAP